MTLDRIVLKITSTPMNKIRETFAQDLKEFLLFKAAQYTEKLRLEGKPFLTFEYQTREFLDAIFVDDDKKK